MTTAKPVLQKFRGDWLYKLDGEQVPENHEVFLAVYRHTVPGRDRIIGYLKDKTTELNATANLVLPDHLRKTLYQGKSQLEIAIMGLPQEVRQGIIDGNPECLSFIERHSSDLEHIAQLPADFIQISYSLLPSQLSNTILGASDMSIPHYKSLMARINSRVSGIGECWSIDILLAEGNFPDIERVAALIRDGSFETNAFRISGSGAEPEKIASIVRRVLMSFEPAGIHEASSAVLDSYAIQPIMAWQALAQRQQAPKLGFYPGR